MVLQLSIGVSQAQSKQHLAKGIQLVQDDQYEEAIPILEAAVETLPNNADAHYWLGAAYGLKAQQSNVLKQATLAPRIRKHFERSVALDPNHLDARMALVEFYLQAPSFMGGSKDKALEQAKAIYSRDEAVGVQSLVRVHEAAEEYDKVEQVYKDAIALATDDTLLKLNLGFFYQRTEQYDRAFDTFEKLAVSDNWYALYQVGRTAVFSGQRLARGAEALETYVQHQPTAQEPDLASAHYHLGMVYEQMSRSDDAAEAYARAFELNPQLTEARKALSKLR